MRYARYSVCGQPTENKFLDWFLNQFYGWKTIKKEINGVKYIIEYHRSPFWAYEKPSFKQFLKEKAKTWHGQVWEILPKGSRVGFGCTCIRAWFPRKKMKDFLDREATYVYGACNNK